MNYKVNVHIILMLLLFTNNNVFSQKKALVDNSFIYPSKMDLGEFKSMFFLTLSKLPEDFIEETNTLVYSPLFSYEAKVGLPHDFYVHSGFTTNIISNHISIGLNWIWSKGDLSVSVGDNFSFWVGLLNGFDFASRTYGAIHYPNITIGLKQKDFVLSIRGEASLNLTLMQFVDDIEVEIDKNILNGYTLGAYVEQPLWKDNIVTLGFRANFSRFYYPVWLAYPTFTRFNFIAEAVIGVSI